MNLAAWHTLQCNVLSRYVEQRTRGGFDRAGNSLPPFRGRELWLTNAFSKKLENHKHQVALHFMHYNFCRIHQTLRVTPAMEAGIAGHVWGLEEIVGLLD
jgi:hypothetical protein